MTSRCSASRERLPSSSDSLDACPVRRRESNSARAASIRLLLRLHLPLSVAAVESPESRAQRTKVFRLPKANREHVASRSTASLRGRRTTIWTRVPLLYPQLTMASFAAIARLKRQFQPDAGLHLAQGFRRQATHLLRQHALVQRDQLRHVDYGVVREAAGTTSTGPRNPCPEPWRSADEAHQIASRRTSTSLVEKILPGRLQTVRFPSGRELFRDAQPLQRFRPESR